jgi:carbon storage regulator
VGEEIVIADQIRVRIIGLRGNRVRLAIAAPESVPIHRAEIHAKRVEFNCAASTIADGVPEPV